MHTAIAEGWLARRAQRFVRGEYGANNREDMLNALATTSDEELAEEAWYGEGLCDDEEASNADLEALVEAFADIRQNFAQHFPATEGDAVDRDEDINTNHGVESSLAQSSKPEPTKTNETTPDATTKPSSRPWQPSSRWKDRTSEALGQTQTIIGARRPEPTTASGSSAAKDTRP
jgi:hypothetical protein